MAKALATLVLVWLSTEGHMNVKHVIDSCGTSVLWLRGLMPLSAPRCPDHPKIVNWSEFYSMDSLFQGYSSFS